MTFSWISDSFIVPRLYCVGVLAYDFCDVIVAYYFVGVDGWCDILDIFQSNLAELPKESNVDDIVLDIKLRNLQSHFVLSDVFYPWDQFESILGIL